MTTVLPFAYVRRRPCLVCEQPFHSAGAHNRVCLPCKYKADPKEWE